jgi:hypothetical protein
LPLTNDDRKNGNPATGQKKRVSVSVDWKNSLEIIGKYVLI